MLWGFAEIPLTQCFGGFCCWISTNIEGIKCCLQELQAAKSCLHFFFPWCSCQAALGKGKEAQRGPQGEGLAAELLPGSPLRHRHQIPTCSSQRDPSGHRAPAEHPRRESWLCPPVTQPWGGLWDVHLHVCAVHGPNSNPFTPKPSAHILCSFLPMLVALDRARTLKCLPSSSARSKVSP